MAEIHSKLQEKLSKNLEKRKVSPVLRLLLVDTKFMFHYRNLSIWYPKESHLTNLKEGIVTDFYNIEPRGNALCSTSKTGIKTSDFDLDRFDHILRCVTPISKIFEINFKPLFYEYDTVGIIVYLDIKDNFQNIWLSDENKRYFFVF